MALPAWLSRFRQDQNVHAKRDPVLHPGWRRTLLLAVPFTALAFALGIVFELLGQASLFDLVAYSLSIAALTGFELLLLFYPNRLSALVALLISCVSIFLLAKFVFVLFLAPPSSDLLGELTESFFWTPIVYIAAFWIPGVRWGRFGVILFGVLTPALSALYVLTQPAGPVELKVFYALTQFNLANVVMILLTRSFALFQSRFAQVQDHGAAMEQLAHTDTLTGLPNRLSLETALKRALRAKKPFAVIFIDLDRFKRINDTQGHAAGDELLIGVAERLGRAVRPQDTLARVSGDEFVLLAHGVQAEQAALEDRTKAARHLSATLRACRAERTSHRQCRFLSLPARRRRRQNAFTARRQRDVPRQGRRT